MPKTHAMLPSKYLQKDDVGSGALLTIADCVERNIAMEDQEPKMRWCLLFTETDKPLIMNSTNIQLCEAILGSDDTDDWKGQQIVAYTDPAVSFGGKIVGGIRVRKSRKPQPVVKPSPAARQPGEDDDEIGF